MSRPTITLIPVLLLLGAMSGCALLGEDTSEVGSPGVEQIREQAVELHPVFLLQGLDELPAGVHLQELHLGVGALFFEPVDQSTSGIAYANRIPFSLHFQIDRGVIRAEAPAMVLPQGGEYQISMQLEPQALLAIPLDADWDSFSGGSEHSSLILTGYVLTASREPKEPLVSDEPAPLPWRPAPEANQGSREESKSYSWEEVPFFYRSDRSVRFILDQVQLESGSTIDLVMQVPVGLWVEESVYPAIDQALDEISEQHQVGDPIDEAVDIDLTGLLDSLGDGLDGLIGGIEVTVR